MFEGDPAAIAPHGPGRPDGLGGAGVATELSAVARARAQLAAYEAGLVARLADLRSDRDDRSGEQPGAAVEGWLPGAAAGGGG